MTIYRANMNRDEILRSIEKPILTFFPYETTNFEEAAEKVGWRYNK